LATQLTHFVTLGLPKQFISTPMDVKATTFEHLVVEICNVACNA